MLSWALQHLEKKTWPRDDYKELIELLIVPGPGHHARWMSKLIYNLKMKLLSNEFEMSPEELQDVTIISEFISLHYVKYWFEAPLSSAAARVDLDFMVDIMNYGALRLEISASVLQSLKRHLWYITPQLIPLALTDEGLEDSSREDIAKAIYSTPREPI